VSQREGERENAKERERAREGKQERAREREKEGGRERTSERASERDRGRRSERERERSEKERGRGGKNLDSAPDDSSGSDGNANIDQNVAVAPGRAPQHLLFGVRG
jgi:hypothetical protein